jgi:hypothetical protein
MEDIEKMANGGELANYVYLSFIQEARSGARARTRRAFNREDRFEPRILPKGDGCYH